MTRGRTPGEWIVIGATFACVVYVALVVIAGFLELLGFWP
jgi:hypothetical protein